LTCKSEAVQVLASSGFSPSLLVMKPLLYLVAMLGVCSAPIQAERVGELKNERKAKRQVVDDWFRAELIKLAKRAKTDEERKKVLTANDWEWDAGKAGVTSITLKEDGSGIHHYQGAAFAWTNDGWAVRIVSSTGAVANLKFDPDTLNYTGKDFDGKNPIKGSLKLEP
jgi:hypothetical protein